MRVALAAGPPSSTVKAEFVRGGGLATVQHIAKDVPNRRIIGLGRDISAVVTDLVSAVHGLVISEATMLAFS